jgi:hypothetical protein
MLPVHYKFEELQGLEATSKAIELHLGKKSRKASRAHVGDGFGLPAAGLVASHSPEAGCITTLL